MTSLDTSTAADLELFGAARRAALETVRANIAAFRDGYPDDTTESGRYRPRKARDGYGPGANIGWTTSFWPGMLWLGWEATGDEAFREPGLRAVDDFADRVERDQDLDTHDIGFLYSLSCVAAVRLVHSTRGRVAARAAADRLMTRFLEPAGIIQAWGDLSDPAQRGRTIIDSLMNLPLLYWAADETGEDRFRSAAVRHATQLAEHIVRADDSTFHTFHWDPETGAPLYGSTAQGHADDSCWARGQAWGIYGFALTARHCGDPGFLRASRRCADRFLDGLPADGVAYWDLVFTDGSDQPRDTSAAAIAVCGLLELAAQVEDPQASERYAREARRILVGLVEGYVPAPGEGPQPLLGEAVYDMPKLVGVREGCLWGDYFYLEGLTRVLEPHRRSYWW